MKSTEIEDLFFECQDWACHVSLTWQHATNYSVEIYKGYKQDYEKIYYSDGNMTLIEAVQKGLKFMKEKRDKRKTND